MKYIVGEDRGNQKKGLVSTGVATGSFVLTKLNLLRKENRNGLEQTNYSRNFSRPRD